MSQDFSVSTTVKLIRAQHELQQRTASHLNVKVEDLNDISENVLDEAVSSVVSEKFDLETLMAWAQSVTNKAAVSAFEDLNFQAIVSGEETVSKEQFEDDPMVTLMFLIKQIPSMVYQGYLVGVDEDKKVNSRATAEDVAAVVQQVVDKSKTSELMSDAVFRFLEDLFTKSGAEFVVNELMTDMSTEGQSSLMLGIVLGDLLRQRTNHVCP